MDANLPILCAALIVAGVWGLLLALYLPTVVASLGVLVAAACFGVPFGNWNVGPVTLSVDRLAILALVALAGTKWLLAGMPTARLRPMDWVLAALLLLSLAGAVFRPWAALFPGDMPPWYRFASSLAAPAAVFWVLRFRTPRVGDARHCCLFFIGFGLYLAVTAVAERHGPGWLVFPRYILQPQNLYVGRAVGPFLASPTLGTWLTIATAATVLWLGQVGGPARVVLLLLLPLLAFGEYLCLTRSAWLGFLIAVPLATFLSGLRLPRGTLATGMVALALVAGLYAGGEFIMPHRAEGREVVARSTEQRLALAQRALALWADHPVLGCGFGQFEHASRAAGGRTLWASNEAARGLASHNLLLRILAETGLVGTALLLSLYGLWLRRACRLLTRPAAGDSARLLAALFLAAFVAYWAEAMFHDVTHMMIGNLTLFCLAGAMHWQEPAAVEPSAAPVPAQVRRAPDDARCLPAAVV